MINECVAKGDYLNYFSKKNTTIIHCPLSIVHSLDRAINSDLCLRVIQVDGPEAVLYRRKQDPRHIFGF